jgi:acyl carrier protein
MNPDLATLRDAIIAMTVETINRRLDPGPETGQRDFASLGVDSVNVFEIILKIETRYEVTIKDTFLFTHRTPVDAAQALHAILREKNAPNVSQDQGTE